MTNEHARHDDQDARRLRELVEELARDRPSARASELIAELVLGWRPYYRGWLAARAGEAVAEVVVSTVDDRLLRLLRRKQEFGSPWRSVVWATVRNELISERRRRAKRAGRETPVAEVVAEGTADAADAETDHGPEYDVARLRRARAKLSGNDRQVLELLFDRNLGRAEAAAELGIEAGTLSVRKLRALERLRKAWAEEAEGEDV